MQQKTKCFEGGGRRLPHFFKKPFTNFFNPARHHGKSLKDPWFYGTYINTTYFQMIDKAALEKVVTDALAGSDKFLVSVEISADNRIVVEIERRSGSITIDDCVEINNLIEANFDRNVEDYELEVGSAGLTAPFKIKAQYDKNCGNPVEVLTKDGNKLRGTLKSATDTDFTITITKKVKPEGAKRPIMVEEDTTINYNDIKYTKNIID